MITAAMSNVALQNFFDGLRRGWETANGRRLEDPEAEFGDDGGAIRGLLAGHAPTSDVRSTVLRAVALLGGDDQDASGALILAMMSPDHSGAEETVIMNDRLLTRLQNLERYIRRIGKVDEFHAWVAAGASKE